MSAQAVPMAIDDDSLLAALSNLAAQLNRVACLIERHKHLLKAAKLERIEPMPGRLKIADIQRYVADWFEISMADLCGPKQSAEIVYSRHIAMYLVRELTQSSYAQIGRMFGGRHHTTVIHGIRRIARSVSGEMQKIREGLTSHC